MVLQTGKEQEEPTKPVLQEHVLFLTQVPFMLLQTSEELANIPKQIGVSH